MNSSECYKCRKTGHFARECPSSEGRGGGYRGARGGGGYRGGRGGDSRSSQRGTFLFFKYFNLIIFISVNIRKCMSLKCAY